MGQWLCVPMVLFGIWLYVRPGAARSAYRSAGQADRARAK